MCLNDQMSLISTIQWNPDQQLNSDCIVWQTLPEVTWKVYPESAVQIQDGELPRERGPEPARGRGHRGRRQRRSNKLQPAELRQRVFHTAHAHCHHPGLAASAIFFYQKSVTGRWRGDGPLSFLPEQTSHIGLRVFWADTAPFESPQSSLVFHFWSYGDF